MVLLKNLGSPCRLRSLCVKLVAWFGWLPTALSQLELSEAVTGSVSFVDAGMTSLGHVAAFTASFLRGRLDLEMSSRDVVATLRGPKLKTLNEYILTTDSQLEDASVVMLSAHPPTSSMKQFMEYISSAHAVGSILLQSFSLSSAPALNLEKCECGNPCHCRTFWTTGDITILLAAQMPGILKRLSDSQCLLPSLHCLRNGCHGCKVGLLHVEMIGQRSSLIEGDPEVGFPAAICETLDIVGTRFTPENAPCICIPIHPPCSDDWTRLLIRMMRCKDEETRGATVIATEALQSYLDGTRPASAERVDYSSAALMLPRLIEVLVNLVLTGWFRVDGFSSSLVARRAIRDYVVDTRGNGFVASVFLTKAVVNASVSSSHICQVLTFRPPLTSLRTLALVAGGVNLICCVWWSVAVAFGAGLGKWSDIYSMAPSKARVSAIMAAMAIGLGMDCLHLYLNRIRWREISVIWAAIFLEIACIAAVGTVAGTLGVRAFGTWLYSALQCMVWVKWGFGCYLLGEYLEDESRWADSGILVYSSAFLLSAILAGVGGKWE